MGDQNSRLVYSSENGRICPSCSQPVAKCRCRQEKKTAPGDGIVRVGRETKGRKGKGVTLVRGVDLPQDELKKLSKQLKKKCGSGGTVKEDVIEIQGDHRETVLAELQKLGFKAKIAGG